MPSSGSELAMMRLHELDDPVPAEPLDVLLREAKKGCVNFRVVLAEEGGWFRGVGTFTKPDGRPDCTHCAQRCMAALLHVASLLKVGMLGCLGDSIDCGRGATVFLADVHDLLLAVLHGPFGDERVDGVSLLGTAEHVLKSFELHPVRVAHGVGEALPLAGLEGEHPDVAVFAREDGRRRAEAHSDSCPTLEDAILGVGTDVLAPGEDGGYDFSARDIEVLAATGQPATVDCGTP